MRTAEENETELDRMKREANQWLDKYGLSAPPFIHVAVNAFPPNKITDSKTQMIKKMNDFIDSFNVWCESNEIEPAKDIPLSAKRTAEGIMPNPLTIWMQANQLSTEEFKEWFNFYLKELEKYTEK